MTTNNFGPAQRARMRDLLTVAVRAQETLWNALRRIEIISGKNFDQGSNVIAELALNTSDTSLTPTDYNADDDDLDFLLASDA